MSVKTGKFILCVFCFGTYEDEKGDDGYEWIGRTQQGFPEYKRCGCRESEKFRAGWLKSGMKKGYTSGICLEVKIA